MKPTTLLMVTSAFPYGQGEAFVQADLDHLVRHFDAVDIAPCFVNAAQPPRSVVQHVNLDYARRRWGAMRWFTVAAAFGRALLRYRWRDDARVVLGQPHRLENTVEFVRALYRAQLFEDFLAREVAVKQREFDLIYFYWMVPEIMGAIQFRARSGRKLAIVARAHGGDLYEDRRSGGYCGLRASVAAGLDAIFCISDHGRAYLAARYPGARARLHTARLGVDDPGRLNVQPPGGALSIVSCSFMVAGKRLHLIVAAIAHLIERDPALEIRWTHIGDGELFAQLRALVHAHIGTRAQVVFKGYLLPEQIMALYACEHFDVFVNVSDCEGVPVSLMEASAVGIPMVATDVGGSGEIVNAANGLLIAADADVATIAAALVYFKDRARAAPYRAQARQQWQQRFNAQTNYAAFGRQLRALLAPAPDQQ